MAKIRILDLCSGIGGFSLGLEATGGFETVAFCEVEEFCCKVLNKHWPGVPIYNDLKELGNDPKRIVQEFDLICGGIPCQPFSVAGKQKGKEDDRHLWPYMFEIVKYKKPAWVIVENVGGFVNVALDDVCLNLEAEGYATQSFIIPACGVEAPHRRDRIWIIGKNMENPGRSLRQGSVKREAHEDEVGRGHADQLERSGSTSGSHVANAEQLTEHNLADSGSDTELKREGQKTGTAHGSSSGSDVSNPSSIGSSSQSKRNIRSLGEESKGEERTRDQSSVCSEARSTEESRKDVPNTGSEGSQGRGREHGLSEASGQEQASRRGDGAGDEELKQKMANSESDRLFSGDGRLRDGNGNGLLGNEERDRSEVRSEVSRRSRLRRKEDVADTERLGQQGQGELERPSNTEKDSAGQASELVDGSQGQTEEGHIEPGVGGMADGLSARLDGHYGFEREPSIPRVAHGIPDRVHRLKALGNAIVPQIIRNIGLAILEEERKNG